MNIMNKLPIAAAVIGLALVFTQSAFKNTTQDPNYYKDPLTNQWKPLGDRIPGTAPGMYSCDETPVPTICTAYFDPNTNPHPAPADKPNPSDFTQLGLFVLN